jgi:hypothetical protein
METSMVSRYLIVVASAVIVAAGCTRASEKLTPEASRVKGDELLREMSKNLGGLQTFAYTDDEVREDVKGGNKVVKRASRRVVMRRPSAITFTSKGDALDLVAWYDGKDVTLVSNTDRVWARGPMPPTLDEALDFLSAEYAIQMPTADLLYSSPYDAVMTPDTTGGWVDVQNIGSGRCDHLAYQQPVVDWEIWLSEERRLPCRARIVYKNEPGQPTVTVTYSGLDLSPPVTDDTFVAKIPDGFQRIKIMRHATIDAPTVEAAESDHAKAESAAKKSPK